MGVYIGCDIGTVSVKAVAVVDDHSKLDKISNSDVHRQLQCRSPLLNGSKIFLSKYHRISTEFFSYLAQLLVCIAVDRIEIKHLPGLIIVEDRPHAKQMFFTKTICKGLCEYLALFLSGRNIVQFEQNDFADL